MATYEITSPDGQRLEITAPDDATQEQVLAYAQANFAQSQQDRQRRIEAQIAADRELYSPVKGMSGLDRFLAGAGRSFVETGEGLGQIFGFGPTEQEVSERRRLDEPLMATTGGQIGSITGTVAQGLALPGGQFVSGARLLPALAAGAAQGGLLSGVQAVGEGESRLENAATGAAFGAAGTGITRGLSRVLDPLGVRNAAALERQAMGADDIIGATALPGMSPRREAAAELLERYGVAPTLGQRTGAKPIQTLESVLAEMPATSARMQAQTAAQQTGVQRALSGMLGEQTDSIDAAVLEKAFDRIGKGYKDIAAGTNISLGDDFLNRLSEVDVAYSRFLPTDVRPAYKARLDDLLDIAQSGQLSGERYQAIRSSLGKAAAGTQDTGYKEALKGLQSALDEQFAKAASPANLAKKLELDKQYRLAKTLNAPSVINAASGELSIPNAARAIEAAARKGPVKQDARELLQAATMLLPDRVGNSGTAQRTMMQNALTGQAMPGTLGLGAGLLTGDPVTGLATAGALYGGPRAVMGLMNTRAGGRYLAGEALPNLPPWLSESVQRSLGMLPLAADMSQ